MATTENPRFTALIDHMRTGLCAEYEASDASVEGSPKNVYMDAAGYAAFVMNEPAAKSLIDKWRAGIDETESLAAFNAADAAGRVRIL